MISVVIVGVGKMGRHHLRALSQIPDVRVAALVDPNKHESFECVDSLEDVRVDFDCAIVASPTSTHHSIATALVERRKHVLVEKPFCATYEQCQDLGARAKKNGVRVAVGHIERFNPAVAKLREVIRDDLAGTPVHFQFTRADCRPEKVRAGANVALSVAIHDIDIFRLLAGKVRSRANVAHATFHSDIRDTVEIVLESESGATATIHADWISPDKVRTIQMLGSKATASVDYVEQSCTLAFRKMGGDGALGPLKRAELAIDRVDPLRAQLRQFIDFVTHGEAGMLCLSEDASAAVAVAENALRDWI